jgi:hypothetical protein
VQLGHGGDGRARLPELRVGVYLAPASRATARAGTSGSLAPAVLAAGRTLLGTWSRNPAVRWLLPRVLPWVVRIGLFPRLQRRLFFGAPLPPLDPGFGFRSRPGVT